MNTLKKGLFLMMTVWSRERLYWGRIIFRSCLNGYVPSVPVNVGFGRRLRIYMQSVALIMTRTRQQHTISMRWFRIGFIMQLQDRLQPKLCITMRIIPKSIWAWQLGKTLPMDVSWNLMSLLQRTIYQRKK